MLDELLRHPILAFRFVIRRALEIPSKGLPSIFHQPREDDDFDHKYGVETAKVVQIVSSDSPSLSHGVRYEASKEGVIRWCIENCGMPHSDTTFVDVGSGKGRVLIIAAMYSFKRIIGVEYSKELTTLCRDNLRKLGLTNRCETIVGDAAEFKFPDGNLFALFYNPFDSQILSRVLKNLAATNGEVWIAWLGPGSDVIEHSSLGRPMLSGDGPAKLYKIMSANNT